METAAQALKAETQRHQLELERERWESERRRLEGERNNARRRLKARDNVRGFALLIILIALVASPFYAMVKQVPPEFYAQYLAPITGIAGAVFGYWFGRGDSK